MAITSKQEAQEKLEILGMGSFDADFIVYEEVKSAYKRMSLRWHPDKLGQLGHLAKTREEAVAGFQRITTAHDDLEAFINGRQEGYFCPHCGKLVRQIGDRVWLCCCHLCGKKDRPNYSPVDVNGKRFWFCAGLLNIDPPGFKVCKQKVSALPNCRKCAGKCYPTLLRDASTGFNFCSDVCKNSSGLGGDFPDPNIAFRITAIKAVENHWANNLASLTGKTIEGVLTTTWKDTFVTLTSAPTINQERDRLIGLINQAKQIAPDNPPPNTLNQAKISAKNTIQTLLHTKQVNPSDLDSNLWNNATNWETHLEEELSNIPEITQFTTKMEQAINSFQPKQTKPPSPDKSSLPTWIIGGLIVGLLVAGGILIFRKKYILKKQPQN